LNQAVHEETTVHLLTLIGGRQFSFLHLTARKV
jgi:hypothetical protein